MIRRIFRRIRSEIYLIQTQLRVLYWRSLFAEFGAHSKVYGNIVVHFPENIYLGARSTLNDNVVLNARATITIGDHVRIASGTIINTAGLAYEKTHAARSHTSAPVTIHNGAWIGSGVLINPGVTIGEDAAVGAGSVVLQDVPAKTLVFGVPARAIRALP